MSEDDRAFLGWLLTLLVGFTAGLSLMLNALWLTALPSVPWSAFAREHWGLYLGTAMCALLALWLYVQVGGKR